MGVRAWLAARAVRSAHVLVVEAPGAFTTRVAAERGVAARGWCLAESPASADVLLVVGAVAGELAEVVDTVWDAMPGPRARVALSSVEDVAAALDEAASTLLDAPAMADDAQSRLAPDLTGEGGEGGHEGMDHGGGHEGMDHRGGHEGMDHGGGHEGMDHGGMDMAPNGIALAEGSEEDRDGLEMDELPVRLGPVLPHWPAGLVLDVALHGDLVVRATARVVTEPNPAEEPPAIRAARRCDDVARVLALAGWERGTDLAREARDALLDHRGDDARALLLDLAYRVEHSRLLGWALSGVGVVPPGRAAEAGLPDTVVGDCRDRLLGLVGRAVAAAHDYAGTGRWEPPTAEGARDVVPVAAWGPLVTGCDLGVARLVVATLGTPPSLVGVRSGG